MNELGQIYYRDSLCRHFTNLNFIHLVTDQQSLYIVPCSHISNFLLIITVLDKVLYLATSINQEGILLKL